MLILFTVAVAAARSIVAHQVVFPLEVAPQVADQTEVETETLEEHP